MAMVDLTGAHRVSAGGRVYWYAWRGGPRIKALPGTPEFAAEFAAHHAARKGGDPSLLSGLIVDWKRSDAWIRSPEAGGLAESTKKAWRRPLSDIQVQFGKVPLRAFADQMESRKRIKRWLRTFSAAPRAADMRKQVMSALLSYAVEEDRLPANPCFGIKNLYANDRSEIIWTPDDIARLMAGDLTTPELMWVFALGCLTGLRQSDLLKLTWNQITDTAIVIPASKSRKRGRTARDAVIPLYGELRTVLALIPKRAITVLTNTHGRPWATGFTTSWRAATLRVGERTLHFHDSRGTAVTALYERQALSLKEIAEIMAWAPEKVERIINRYVRRDALMRDKIRRIDEARQNTSETEVVKPGVKTAP